ncbi:MAG: Chemotaxis protein CheV, partial [uncultured Lysobacter sp.]
EPRSAGPHRPTYPPGRSQPAGTAAVPPWLASAFWRERLQGAGSAAASGAVPPSAAAGRVRGRGGRARPHRAGAGPGPRDRPWRRQRRAALPGGHRVQPLGAGLSGLRCRTHRQCRRGRYPAAAGAGQRNPLPDRHDTPPRRADPADRRGKRACRVRPARKRNARDRAAGGAAGRAARGARGRRLARRAQPHPLGARATGTGRDAAVGRAPGAGTPAGDRAGRHAPLRPLCDGDFGHRDAGDGRLHADDGNPSRPGAQGHVRAAAHLAVGRVQQGDGRARGRGRFRTEVFRARTGRPHRRAHRRAGL